MVMLRILAFLFVLLLPVQILGQNTPRSKLVWNPIHELELGQPALATALSRDRTTLYVLIRGELLLVSLDTGLVVSSIPVDQDIDGMTHSLLHDFFILTSSSSQTVSIKRLDTVVDLSATDRPFFGAARAPVELVVFTDYQCSTCAQFEPLFKALVKDYPGLLKVVIRYYPLDSHPYAREAARASLAAARQNRFAAYHERLYEQQQELNPASFEKLARELGLDLEKFRKDINAPDIRAQVEEDYQAAKSLGINAVPTIYVNNKLFTDWSVEGLRRTIDQELAAADPDLPESAQQEDAP